MVLMEIMIDETPEDEESSRNFHGCDAQAYREVLTRHRTSSDAMVLRRDIGRGRKNSVAIASTL